MIEHISVDPVYKDHATPKIYGFESIITIPIAVDHEYFGSLFGIDRSPKPVSTPAVAALFNGVARVISLRLAANQVSRENASPSSGLCEELISVLADDMRRPVDAIVEAADMSEKKCLDTSSKSSNPSRVCQLVSLLLESALGQAEPVGPVSMAATIEDGGLSIDVWNGGDPIPAERLGHLFAKSWQPTAAGLPMDSLSLHVCRLIVDAHHGSIAATSAVAEGTQFSVRIPMIPADGAAAGSAQRHCLGAKANRVAL